MSAQLEKWHFNVDQYYRLAEVGVLKPDDRVELIGKAARVILVDTELSLIGRECERHVYDFDRSYQESFDRTIFHFADCLARSQPFETGIEDNLLTLRLVDDAYRAAQRNCP